MNAMKPAAQQEKEFSFTDQEFDFLAGLANAKTGIVLPRQKKDMVYGRLVRRLRAHKLASFGEYCALIDSPQGEDEMSHLINAITTNLTSFFRESHHFDHLRDEVLLPLAASSAPRRLRLWSSAASSGMEPYSMAMTVREAIPGIDHWDARILATDIDTNMVATGAAGQYTEGDVGKLPKQYARFVEPGKKPGTVQMKPELQKMIAFKPLNLLEDWPMKGEFDAVFCRNVVIYFDKPTKEVLFEKMAQHVKMQGYLYIGHSENLHGITDRFKLIGRTIYQRVR